MVYAFLAFFLVGMFLMMLFGGRLEKMVKSNRSSPPMTPASIDPQRPSNVNWKKVEEIVGKEEDWKRKAVSKSAIDQAFVAALDSLTSTIKTTFDQFTLQSSNSSGHKGEKSLRQSLEYAEKEVLRARNVLFSDPVAHKFAEGVWMGLREGRKAIGQKAGKRDDVLRAAQELSTDDRKYLIHELDKYGGE